MKKTILIISILSLLFISCKFDTSGQYTIGIIINHWMNDN